MEEDAANQQPVSPGAPVPPSLGHKRPFEETSEEASVAAGADATTQTTSGDESPPLKKIKSTVRDESIAPHTQGSPEPEQKAEPPEPTILMGDNPEEHQMDDQTEAVEVDQGEIMDPNPMDDEESHDEGSDADENPVEAAKEPRPQTAPTWNSGISQGVRISFGSAASSFMPRQRSLLQASATSTPKSTPASTPVDTPVATPREKAHASRSTSSSPVSPPSADLNDQADALQQEAKAEEKKKRHAFHRNDVFWTVPKIDPKPNGSRKTEFIAWCREFLAANKEHVASADARLVRRAFLTRLKETPLSEDVAKTCRRGARSVESAQVTKLISIASGEAPEEEVEEEEDEHEDVDDEEEEAQTTTQTTVLETAQMTEERKATATSGVQLSREEELQQLRKYFPGASETNFCVLCAVEGHRANDCPPPKCQHCQTEGHTSTRCPTRVRCGKCWRLGHRKGQCKEKLRLAVDEETECAVCCSKDHIEDECEALWRTFHPDPDAILKVDSIPTFCYTCGADNHFGADCGLFSGSKPGGASKDKTWSVANRDQYVDAKSQVHAISWVPPPPPPHDFGGRSIKPRTHEYYESDDDDEFDFIQPPIRKGPAPRQNIRINGGGGGRGIGGSSGGGYRGGRQHRDASRGNPPLPPGPPPSLPAKPPSRSMQGGAPVLRGGGSGGGRRGRGGFSRGRGGGQR